MTKLAPGERYFEVGCSVHGVLYEDTDRRLASQVFEAHVAEEGAECFVSRRTLCWVDGSYEIDGQITLAAAPVSFVPPQLQPEITNTKRIVITGAPTEPHGAFAVSSEATETANIAVQAPTAPQTALPGLAGRLTRTSWSPPEHGMAIEAWLAEIELLHTLRDSVQWWVADAIIFGEASYGELYAQAVDPPEAKTVQNWVSVAKAIPVPARRESVKWSLHAELVRMDPEERDKWLDVAETGSLTRRELHAAITDKPEPEMCICHCGHEHRKV